MKHISCPGLDGGNPLHFMAALGVMRLLSRNESTTRMHWARTANGWSPVYERPVDWSLEDLATELSAWVPVLAKTSAPKPELQRQAGVLKADLKKRLVTRKENAADLEKNLKGTTVLEGDKERKITPKEIRSKIAVELKAFDTETATKEAEVARLQLEIGDALGAGVAHLGDIICVTPELFRNKAAAAVQSWLNPAKSTHPATDDPALVIAMLPALACDQVHADGKLINTPYSFSNGASGQCLLKDFRNCATVVTSAHLVATLRGAPILLDSVTGLNWNPADQRSYALQWQDPQKGGKEDPAINALAYLGLSFLPAIPGDTLGAVAWFSQKGSKGFRWPLWESPASADVLLSLLASPPGSIRSVTETRTSETINPTGKRLYFAPSRIG